MSEDLKKPETYPRALTAKTVILIDEEVISAVPLEINNACNVIVLQVDFACVKCVQW